MVLDVVHLFYFYIDIETIRGELCGVTRIQLNVLTVSILWAKYTSKYEGLGGTCRRIARYSIRTYRGSTFTLFYFIIPLRISPLFRGGVGALIVTIFRADFISL